MVINCGGGSDSPPVPTYSVTYDGNTNTEGTAPVDTKTYSTTFSVTVLDKASLTKEGYTFTCWNTQADGNGIDRAPASTFAMGSASVILYAKWTADPTYTVTYDANRGTGDVPIDGNSYLAGLTVTVLENLTLTKTCHAFSGWNTQADGMGTDRAPSSTFKIGSANVLLYAKWMETLYTWYRDADGDGYGNASNTRQACTKPAGYVDTLGDCNDYNSAVYPTATELCDGIDNNCSGIIDEGCVGECWIGQMIACPMQCGVCAGSKRTCGSNGAWLPCDYSLIPQYSSGEICGDSLDNDCDCTVDEGC